MMKMINLRVIHDFLLHQCQLKLLVRSDDMMFQFLLVVILIHRQYYEWQSLRFFVIIKSNLKLEKLFFTTTLYYFHHLQFHKIPNRDKRLSKEVVAK
jgi:hypothetical protein